MLIVVDCISWYSYLVWYEGIYKGSLVDVVLVEYEVCYWVEFSLLCVNGWQVVDVWVVKVVGGYFGSGLLLVFMVEQFVVLFILCQWIVQNCFCQILIGVYLDIGLLLFGEVCCMFGLEQDCLLWVMVWILCLFINGIVMFIGWQIVFGEGMMMLYFDRSEV